LPRRLARGDFAGNTCEVGKGIDHLHPDQRAALSRVVGIVREVFAVAVARATQPCKRSGEIHRIVLFGPLAASGPSVADTSVSGDPIDPIDLARDYTVLVVVSHRDLVAMPKYWRRAEGAIRHDPAIDRPVTMIVHAQGDVDARLARGGEFWMDIARTGIALYERPGAAPIDLTPIPSGGSEDEGIGIDALVARPGDTPDGVLRSWATRIDNAIRVARFCQETDNRRDAAFMLHQAAERAYFCHLLVRGQYAPRTHNLTFLRSLAEASEPRLAPCWPRMTKVERRRFDLLKRAYLDARYAPDYGIELEDLNAIAASVRALRDTVTALCRASPGERPSDQCPRAEAREAHGR
jgi:HEPN domain-containing protein